MQEQDLCVLVLQIRHMHNCHQGSEQCISSSQISGYTPLWMASEFVAEDRDAVNCSAGLKVSLNLLWRSTVVNLCIPRMS